MSENVSAVDIQELASMVEQLTARVGFLENQLKLHHDPDEVTEEIMLAISAAIAAYLGKRATIKQVHFAGRGSGWASQGRSQIQQSHAIVPNR
ncbi:MAG: hypothetical protein Q4G51_11160 [Dermatophilus congolensis]|nr:hypothetical protein [Dermatophilus congolensis]